MTSRSRGPPPSHRSRIETQIIRRREREYAQNELWTGQKNYYEKCEKQNAKYDEWTSPRYQENHANMLEKLRKEREHQETLEKRREKLRELFRKEDETHKIELMLRKSKESNRVPRRKEDIPTEVLRSLNNCLKLEEEDRRRHEAELQLYHQWRSTNPILKHYERMQSARDLKVSWLDQQIELRMRKQQEEEENRKMIVERERLIEAQKLKEEEFKKELETKRERLKADLEKQMEELKDKSKASEELKREENEELKRKLELAKVEEERVEQERKRIEREYALYNVKQYKMRLKKKAEDVVIRLEEERQIIRKLRDLDAIERIENAAKRNEVKQTLEEFLKISEEQKELERCRKKYMDFIFDSEAKLRYEQQDEIWKSEEMARANLLKDVMKTIKEQVESNLQKNRDKQLEIVREREEMIRHIERYQDDMNKLKEDEERRKKETMKRIDEEVRLKQLKKKEVENEELKRIDGELERVRKEEERLQREILNIQKRQGPIRPQRSRIFL